MKKVYLKLKNYSDVPPNEFYWIDLDTKVEMRAPDFDGLVGQARAHRSHNKLTIADDFAEFIEDAICRRAPANFVRQVPGASTSFMGTDEVVKKTDLLMRTAEKNGGKMLCSAGEALERSIICEACPMNKRIMCQTCNGVLDWMRQSFHLPKLALDDKLQVCSVARVLNKAQVHLDTGIIRLLVPATAAQYFPETCWKRKLLTPKEETNEQPE